MRLVRSASVVALCVALCSQPSVAQAEVRTQRDAIGDVARSPVGSNVRTPAPTQAQGDIVATRVAHARRTIYVQVRMRELSPDTNGNFTLISITTRWRVRNVEIDAFPGHWEGRPVTTDAQGRAVACAVTHRIDYDRNRITLKMPRSCLGKPPWVRAGARTTVAGTVWAYADESRGTTVGTTLRYGPRVPF
jgi:hypothetical protein